MSSKAQHSLGKAGQRLLPVVIDDIAHDDPDRLWALLPSREGGQDDYQSITYAILANAINRMSWFMEGKLGKPNPGTFPTVCYIGKADMRYQVIEMAAAKTGFKACLEPSIRLLSDLKMDRLFSHRTQTRLQLI